VLQRVFQVEVACWTLLFLFRMMVNRMVNRNRPVMSKRHPSILSPFSPGHSRDVRSGQRDSALIGHGSELQIGKSIWCLVMSLPLKTHASGSVFIL